MGGLLERMVRGVGSVERRVSGMEKGGMRRGLLRTGMLNETLLT